MRTWRIAGADAVVASKARSHSVSTPKERLFRLAEPTRSNAVVDDHDLGVDHASLCGRSRHLRIEEAVRSLKPSSSNTCMNRPSPACMVRSSSQEWACLGVTSTASSSGRSAIRLARCSAKRFAVRYWFSIKMVRSAQSTCRRTRRSTFANFLFLLHGREGACDADVDAGEIGGNAVRPRIARPAGAAAFARRRRSPPFPDKLGERERGSAVDHGLDIVKRSIGRARGIDAARIVRAVLGAVPAPDGQVQSAGKGDRVVHHHDLLMMRRADREAVVQAKPDLRGMRQRIEKAGNGSRSVAYSNE